MMIALVKAIVGIVTILGGWLSVQWAWRRICGTAQGEDALAGRLGCHGCDCWLSCEGDRTESARTDRSGAK